MATNTGTSADEASEVLVPDRLLDRIEARLPHTEFESADEWIVYALEEVLVRVEAQTDQPEPTVTESEVERRLASLGYLDR